jgi:hypothetical protein
MKIFIGLIDDFKINVNNKIRCNKNYLKNYVNFCMSVGPFWQTTVGGDGGGMASRVTHGPTPQILRVIQAERNQGPRDLEAVMLPP